MHTAREHFKLNSDKREGMVLTYIVSYDDRCLGEEVWTACTWTQYSAHKWLLIIFLISKWINKSTQWAGKVAASSPERMSGILQLR